MNNEEIIGILGDWNFWKKEHNVGLYRENYLDKLGRLIRTEQIVAITGVRRSGKSTLMQQFVKKQIEAGKKRNSFLYINFEEQKFAGLLSLEFLQQIYSAYLEILKPEGAPYILLDEVQTIPMWERFVRSLNEKKEAHLIISGSTSKLLSMDFGALLTGRWVELIMHPLGFSEFLKFNNLQIENKMDILSQKVKIKQLLREYLKFGGFPLVALKGEKEDILRRFFDDIITRDIAERHKIRKLEKLKALAKYYLTNLSSPISYRRIAKFIGLSLDSIERISSYMADAYFCYFVPKFAYSLKEQEVNPRKVYCVDSGLVNIISFRFSDNISKLYENLVFLSLLKTGREIYYYKDKDECDFVVKEGLKIKQLIQVCYNMSDYNTKEREVRSLTKASKELKCNNLLIITEDKEGEETINGSKIKFVPLWKWLLE